MKIIVENWRKFLTESEDSWESWTYPESNPKDFQSKAFIDVTAEYDKSLFIMSGYRNYRAQKPRGSSSTPGRKWAHPTLFHGLTDATSAARSAPSKFPFNKLIIGDIGFEEGGKFLPHKSHREGLDADIYFFMKTPTKHANWKVLFPNPIMRNLDVVRNVAFLKDLSDNGNIKFIMVSKGIYKYLLKNSKGETRKDLIQIAKRGHFAFDAAHSNHYHIRFLSQGKRGSYKSKKYHRAAAARK